MGTESEGHQGLLAPPEEAQSPSSHLIFCGVGWVLKSQLRACECCRESRSVGCASQSYSGWFFW